MSMWQPRRPSPTFSSLGEKLGDPLEAPNRASAERLAIARHGTADRSSSSCWCVTGSRSRRSSSYNAPNAGELRNSMRDIALGAWVLPSQGSMVTRWRSVPPCHTRRNVGLPLP